MRMSDDEVVLYVLKPVDFALLALCSFLVFYTLPRRLLKQFGHLARR